MPQIIEVPGMGRVEFPDGMTDDQISASIQKTISAEKPLSRMDRFTKGLRDPIDAGAQLLTKALPQGVVDAGNRANNWLADNTGLVGRLPEGGVDQQVRENESGYQAQRAAGGESGIDGYRMLGNVVNPVNLALASKIPVAGSLAGRMASGAASGAAIGGGLNPVTSGDNFATEKAKQMALGGIAGGVLPAVTGGIARAVSPNASVNPNLSLLKSEGVRPTVGQALGGMANTVEQKMQSVPIFGDAISAARKSSISDFNKAAINRSVAPIGQKATGIGQQAVRDAGDALGQSYDDAINSIKAVPFDSRFNAELGQLKSLAKSLVPSMRNKFNQTVKDIVEGRMSPNKSMIGETFKKVDSELGLKAAEFKASSVASEKELGDALKQVQSLIQQQAARTNPQFAKALAASDKGWANLVRVEGAAKSAKNAEGVFTPAQLNMAIQAADKSARKRAVSRGTALMQDLGNAGQSVLGSNVPNSGTTDRLLAGLIYGVGGASGFANPLIPAALGGGLLAGAGAYTPLIQRGLVGAVSSRPQLAQPVAEAIRKASPVLIPGAAMGVTGLWGQR